MSKKEKKAVGGGKFYRVSLLPFSLISQNNRYQYLLTLHVPALIYVWQRTDVREEIHSYGAGFRVNTHRNPKTLILRRQRKARVELPLDRIVVRFCVLLVMLEAFLGLRALRAAALQ